jgi:uncharacterized lipoprotein YehR (DUF1307 family)
MKQFIVITCLAVALASCNNGETKKSGTDSTGTTTTTASEVTLPYKLDKPYKNWQIGSTENVAVVMNALKAFIDKDFTTLATLTGDSLEVTLDYFHQKMSRDSAAKFFAGGRAMYKDLSVSMNDYESVISADKKDEWVTIWYKENWIDNKGVADSVSVINDVKIKDGKMIILNETTNHFPKKK